jgi:hypothetical protein
MSRSLDLVQVASLDTNFRRVPGFRALSASGLYRHELWIPAGGSVTLNTYYRPAILKLMYVHSTMKATITDGGANEVQRLTITGGAGTYSLDFNSQVTSNIAYNATAATVQAALEALSNIGVGDVSVTGGPGATAPIDITFTGALGFANVTQMIFGLLDPGLSASTLTTVTPGVAGTLLETIVPSVPYIWHDQCGHANPFASNRDTFTFTNGSAIGGVVRFYLLYDSGG